MGLSPSPPHLRRSSFTAPEARDAGRLATSAWPGLPPRPTPAAGRRASGGLPRCLRLAFLRARAGRLRLADSAPRPAGKDVEQVAQVSDPSLVAVARLAQALEQLLPVVPGHLVGEPFNPMEQCSLPAAPRADREGTPVRMNPLRLEHFATGASAGGLPTHRASASIPAPSWRISRMMIQGSFSATVQRSKPTSRPENEHCSLRTNGEHVPRHAPLPHSRRARSPVTRKDGRRHERSTPTELATPATRAGSRPRRGRLSFSHDHDPTYSGVSQEHDPRGDLRSGTFAPTTERQPVHNHAAPGRAVVGSGQSGWPPQRGSGAPAVQAATRPTVRRRVRGRR